MSIDAISGLMAGFLRLSDVNAGGLGVVSPLLPVGKKFLRFCLV